MAKLKNVFVVDDNEVDSLIIEKIILWALPEVVINKFYNVNTALEVLSVKFSNPAALPDLILLDLAMPGKDGWDFLDRYNQLELNVIANPPIIYILTSSIHFADHNRAKQHKCVENILSKPFTISIFSEISEKHFQINNNE